MTVPVLSVLPTWMHLKMDGAAPCASGPSIWSGEGDPPPIGAGVSVRGNNLGDGVVTGYFVAGGWLGVMVKFDAAPSWYLEKNGGNVDGHCFGAEIRVL